MYCFSPFLFKFYILLAAKKNRMYQIRLEPILILDTAEIATMTSTHLKDVSMALPFHR